MKNLLIMFCLAFVVTSAFAGGHGRHHKHLKHSVIPPAFKTESILISDFDGNIFREVDSDRVRPIASISKLMVALLASEQDPGELLIIPTKRYVASRIPKTTHSLTRNTLLTLALIRSDNFAAQILCLNLPDCVNKMNEKATELGMLNTHYNEPTGLDKGNVSTAHDLMKLLQVAALNPAITSISRMPTAEVSVENGIIKIRNTNPLTFTLDVVVSKTGFTNPAGGCLVMAVNSPVGPRILILLGSRNGKTRIPAMAKLYKEM